MHITFPVLLNIPLCPLKFSVLRAQCNTDYHPSRPAFPGPKNTTSI